MLQLALQSQPLLKMSFTDSGHIQLKYKSDPMKGLPAETAAY